MTQSNDRELVEQFLIESTEGVDQLDADLVALEESPRDTEILARVFRTVHTLKGSCSFLGYSNMESVTHVGESLLSGIREGTHPLDDDTTTALLTLADFIRNALLVIEDTDAEPPDPELQLIAHFKQLFDRVPTTAEAQAGAIEASSLDPNSTFAESPRLGDVLLKAGKITPGELEKALELQRSGDPRKMGEILKGVANLSDDDLQKNQETQHDAHKGVAKSNIRVQVEQLDRLMNLVGELVLTRNQILQRTDLVDDVDMLANAQRLNLITSELQEGIMKIRMQPIGNLWSKLPRVVRDISRACGKQVRVEMIGKETELDKSLLEAIMDPLTHVVRNAIDHGIEMPEERIAKGKPAEGVLRLRAFHASGQVNIQISDDGKGLDLGRIRDKAVAKSLVTSEQANRLSDRETAALIFNPGFSTAEKVTNISGRGVGMDVVKTNIEKIGGTVDMKTTDGKGCMLEICIPLTLAIIPALIVSSDRSRYAIPQVSLVELVRLDGTGAKNPIEDLLGCPVYRLRGDLLPLVYLRAQMGLEPAPEVGEDGEPAPINIVVLQAESRLFGLVVDDINDTEEIVVKPLDKQLKSISCYAGTTIMGDGRVALILDVTGIAKRAKIITETRRDQKIGREEERAVGSEATRSLILFDSSPGKRMALALDSVDRLEEIAQKDIEISGEREVIQYRGEIMPLLDVAKAVGLPSIDRSNGEPLQVIVHKHEGHSIGLIVSEILDIVESDAHVDPIYAKDALEGSAVIAGQVTDCLSLDKLIDSAFMLTSNEESEKALNALEASRLQAAERVRKNKQFCTFYVMGMQFGIDVQQVQEIIRIQEMTDVPLTSSTVQGLINLRGQNVMAIDMRSRLGLPPRERTLDSEDPSGIEAAMNVIVRTDDCVVSILVDSIGDVLEVPESWAAEVPESVPSTAREVLSNVYKLDGQLLLTLDVERTIDLNLAACDPSSSDMASAA